MYMDKTSVLRGKKPFLSIFIFDCDILKDNVVLKTKLGLSMCNALFASSAASHHHGWNIIHACSIVQCVSM